MDQWLSQYMCTLDIFWDAPTSPDVWGFPFVKCNIFNVGLYETNSSAIVNSQSASM